jgi:predicted RNA-binding protein with PUA-like domain
MAYWLFKQEPDQYRYDDLESDGRTEWDGVTNNLALQNLRKVKLGDRVFFYHSGKEKAIVGEMRVVGPPRPGAGEKTVVVDVEPVRRLQHPVSLRAIKENPHLRGWELVRLPRLSVVPVTKREWQQVEQLSKRSVK